jgi:hypothetical protein
MTTTTEPKKEASCGGRKWGPPSEEERQQREAEFKQEFLDEYKKRHGDSLISAEQTWELYQAVEERWHAKKKEHRQQRRSSPSHEQGGSPSRHHGSSPHHRRHSPAHFEEKRKQIFTELHQDFQTNFTTAHGAEKVNAEQAWSLIQKVQHTKREKWQADRQKHGHGQGDHGRHSPPRNQ